MKVGIIPPPKNIVIRKIILNNSLPTNSFLDNGYSTAVGLFNSVVNVILLVFVNWVVQKLNDGEGL